MKKILYVLIALFAFTFLTGCDYEYKDDLQKAIDNFDNKNYTLNVYANGTDIYAYKGEEIKTDYDYCVTIMVDGKRETYHYVHDDIEERRYRVRHKDEVDLYHYVDEEWKYIETVNVGVSFSLFTVIDFSSICHDDFNEVSEGKWVPKTDKYNQIYAQSITDYTNALDNPPSQFSYSVEGFAINVVDGVIANVEFTLKEAVKTPDGRYYSTINYVLEYSEIGDTHVARLNVSKDAAE